MKDKIKIYLKALWTKLHADASDLWQRDKAFLIAFGVVIVALRFNSILINLITISAKSLYNSTVAKTDKLQKQENETNNQANQLVDEANKLPDSEGPITDDWNEK